MYNRLTVTVLQRKGHNREVNHGASHTEILPDRISSGDPNSVFSTNHLFLSINPGLILTPIHIFTAALDNFEQI